MANQLPVLDGVFSALSDPTRRAVVARLGRGPAAVGELADGFAMTLPSFLKHVRVLESSGLIHTTKSGRVRTCTLNRGQVAVVSDWLTDQRAVWEQRTNRLESFVISSSPTEAARTAESTEMP
jgi:DNA-binding transcriptional ArsR family regulator